MFEEIREVPQTAKKSINHWADKETEENSRVNKINSFRGIQEFLTYNQLKKNRLLWKITTRIQ